MFLSTFKHNLKTELFDIVYKVSEREPPDIRCHYAPLIHTTLCKCVLFD